MEPSLHHVTESDLPQLKQWLEQFLPDSVKLYCTVRETLQGRWPGTTFVTLGWPDILAVGEGSAPKDSTCYEYHMAPRTTCVFSPDQEHLEALLLYPGYLDWSQPIAFQAASEKMRSTIIKVSQAKGGNCVMKTNYLLEASQEELPPRPAPEGFELRALDPDLHTDYVMSTWPHSRNGSRTYIQEMLRRFPSIGLFDKNNECIRLEIGNEYGAMGMLHVREEFRGRGLGKVITSQLAQKYFCDDLPVVAMTIKSNEASLRMHTSIGFRVMGEVDWIFFYTGSLQEFMDKIGYVDIY
ncbi:glycine n-acyltransferase [Plakobranchus ocellatus]|uniref:Glycine N-acyltransferase-like protein n=1 Tax=Plakobranchus ocellatus TaxID=259542 RepID=A0AAV3YLY5_9GAST|nr:glycine n-acyltransferase [Plakobranchus ocellatus]